MIDGKYRIKIDTPLGPRIGRANLRTKGDDVVIIDINAPYVGVQHAEGSVDGDSFSAEGAFGVFLIGKISYSLSGEVDGDNIKIHIESNKGKFNFTGTRV